MSAPGPSATYRLQFRNGMDFARAALLVPYLRDLGISHLYASPLAQAVTGSTHGYDVIDHGRFDETLGGMEGFLMLSDRLRDAGLGLILDIVPNHMAASTENPWWRDVLKHGQASRYASHFDIDWSAPKLVLPILGRTYGDVLEAGEFTLARARDGYCIRYFEHAFPLSPASNAIIAEAAGSEAPDDAALARMAEDHALIHRIHEMQNYRLAFWRLARDGLTNRRFFEIADLVGVRVEEPRVFDDVHALVFRMVEEGRVDGVRVDHVDGLADPTGYLARLARNLPRPVPIWVEKILGAGEALPKAWPIAGATGYEFAALAAAVLTDGAGVETLSEGYDSFTGAAHDLAEMRLEAKHEILAQNLAAELAILTDHAEAALASDIHGRDWGHDSVRRSLAALLVGLPVYRSYLDGGPPSASDSAILAEARASALADVELDDPAPIEILLRHLVEGQEQEDRRLRIRFQQTSGALMAKAVEDTLFYRYNRLISANEVGADPGQPSIDTAAFHSAMEARARATPAALNATATHDTKRGEDARMRIAAIAEMPDIWLGSITAFDRELGEVAESIPAETRWQFYQGLLGAWDRDAAGLHERTREWMQKSAREAKLFSSWVRPDEGFERSLMEFIDAVFAGPRFLDLFDELTAPFRAIGFRKSLVQLALKLTAPGIPDIYQGTEALDLSYVDPDNRRPPDFEALRDEAADLPKRALIRFALDLRGRNAALFAEGAYRSLPVAAHERLLVFERIGQGARLLVALDLSGRRREGALPENLAAETPRLGFPETARDPQSIAAALAEGSVFIGLY